MHNIIIIDDHQMLRDMITEVLTAHGDFNVVASSGDATNSLELYEKYKPELILMDICTDNNSNGITYAKILKKNYPNLKIVIMTGVLDLNFINEAKKANVDSFIYKNISKSAFIMTLNSTLEGYSIYPNEKNNTNILSKNILSSLNENELNVITIYCKVLDRDEVAKQMGISPRTLKSYISSIYEKTGYNNLTKLAIYCVANELIVPKLL